MMKGGDHMSSQDVLRRRYSVFSTTSSYVTVNVENRDSGEQAALVIDNTEWYMSLLDLKEHFIFTKQDYIRFMTEKHDTVFQLPGDLFSQLKKSYEAPPPLEFEKDREQGLVHLADRYLQKFSWSPGGDHAWLVKPELQGNRSFLRFLLEMGLVVRRDCESGRIYVEPQEIDAVLA